MRVAARPANHENPARPKRDEHRRRAERGERRAGAAGAGTIATAIGMTASRTKPVRKERGDPEEQATERPRVDQTRRPSRPVASTTSVDRPRRDTPRRTRRPTTTRSRPVRARGTATRRVRWRSSATSRSATSAATPAAAPPASARNDVPADARPTRRGPSPTAAPPSPADDPACACCTSGCVRRTAEEHVRVVDLPAPSGGIPARETARRNVSPPSIRESATAHRLGHHRAGDRAATTTRVEPRPMVRTPTTATPNATGTNDLRRHAPFEPARQRRRADTEPHARIEQVSTPHDGDDDEYQPTAERNRGRGHRPLPPRVRAPARTRSSRHRSSSSTTDGNHCSHGTEPTSVTDSLAARVSRIVSTKRGVLRGRHRYVRRRARCDPSRARRSRRDPPRARRPAARIHPDRRRQRVHRRIGATSPARSVRTSCSNRVAASAPRASAGLLAATDDVVCFMDCDGSFDGADLDRGRRTGVSRRCRSRARARARPRKARGRCTPRLANRFLAWELRRRTHVPLRDLGPMRAMRRTAICCELGVEDRRFGWPLEMVLRSVARRLAHPRSRRALRAADRTIEGDRHRAGHGPRGARHGEGAAMKPGVTLIVIAKSPQPGRVKTRLCPPCTPQRGRRAGRGRARRHARRHRDRARPPPRHRARRTDRTVAPAGRSTSFRRSATASPNGSATRSRAFAVRHFSSAWTRRRSTRELVGAAVETLGDRMTDAVLGPALDGGWWGIGLRRPDPRVFDGVEMSTEHTHAQQLARLTALGLRTYALPSAARRRQLPRRARRSRARTHDPLRSRGCRSRAATAIPEHRRDERRVLARISQPRRACERPTASASRSGRAMVRAGDSAERRLLERVDGPVLDIGCGPARHALVLARVGRDLPRHRHLAARARRCPQARCARCCTDRSSIAFPATDAGEPHSSSTATSASAVRRPSCCDACRRSLADGRPRPRGGRGTGDAARPAHRPARTRRTAPDRGSRGPRSESTRSTSSRSTARDARRRSVDRQRALVRATRHVTTDRPDGSLLAAVGTRLKSLQRTLHEQPPRRTHRRDPRFGARRHLHDLFRHRPLLAFRATPAELVPAAVAPRRSVPSHTRAARRDRLRVDPAAARQALDRLSEALHVATVLEHRERARAARDLPADRRIAVPVLHRPGQHQPLVPVAVQLSDRALLGGVDDDRRAHRAHRREVVDHPAGVAPATRHSRASLRTCRPRPRTRWPLERRQFLATVFGTERGRDALHDRADRAAPPQARAPRASSARHRDAGVPGESHRARGRRRRFRTLARLPARGHRKVRRPLQPDPRRTPRTPPAHRHAPDRVRRRLEHVAALDRRTGARPPGDGRREPTTRRCT